MRAYLFKFNKKAILCIRSSSEEFSKVSDLLNSDYSGYNYGFSSTNMTKNNNGIYYTSLEILDRSTDNINGLIKKANRLFGSDLVVEPKEKACGDIRKILASCIDEVVEKHK